MSTINYTNAKYIRFGNTGLLFKFESDFEFDFDRYEQVNGVDDVHIDYYTFIATIPGYYQISHYEAYDRESRECAIHRMDEEIKKALKALKKIKDNNYKKL